MAGNVSIYVKEDRRSNRIREHPNMGGVVKNTNHSTNQPALAIRVHRRNPRKLKKKGSKREKREARKRKIMIKHHK